MLIHDTFDFAEAPSVLPLIDAIKSVSVRPPFLRSSVAPDSVTSVPSVHSYPTTTTSLPASRRDTPTGIST